MNSIYEKYSSIVDGFKSGAVRGLTMEVKMEILRYCESRVGRSIPTDMSCNTCLMSLIELFVNLKE